MNGKKTSKKQFDNGISSFTEGVQVEAKKSFLKGALNQITAMTKE